MVFSLCLFLGKKLFKYILKTTVKWKLCNFTTFGCCIRRKKKYKMQLIAAKKSVFLVLHEQTLENKLFDFGSTQESGGLTIFLAFQILE